MTARSSAVLRRVVASLLVVVGSSVAALVYWGILWSRADSAISCDSSRLSEVFGSKDVEAHPYLSDWPVAMMCKWASGDTVLIEPLGGWQLTIWFYVAAVACVLGLAWIVIGEVRAALRSRGAAS
jgi:disulfide bond formation protein DsbB